MILVPLGGLFGWLHGAPLVSTPVRTRSPVRLWLRSRTREYGWPVLGWVGSAFEVTRHRGGTFDIELLASDPVLSQPLLDIDGGMDVGLISFDAYVRDWTAPLWTGPVSSWRPIWKKGRKTIRFTCRRSAMESILKRRLVLTTNGAKADGTALGGLTGAADGAARALMINHGLSGTPIVPGTYPGGASRTDFGDWAATCVTAVATSPNTLNVEVADGRNLLQAVLEICDKGDLGLECVETSPGVFEITVRVGYQMNDFTDEVILSPRLGGLSEFSADADLETVENVVKMKGKTGTGVGGYQADDQALFQYNSTSGGIYGVMEGAYTGPDMSNNSAANEAAYVLAQQANPTLNFEAMVMDTDSLQFNVHYTIGDLVRIRTEEWGIEADRLCVGARANWTGRRWAIAGIFGRPLASRDAQREILPHGKPGGFGAGSRFVSTRG